MNTASYTVGVHGPDGFMWLGQCDLSTIDKRDTPWVVRHVKEEETTDNDTHLLTALVQQYGGATGDLPCSLLAYCPGEMESYGIHQERFPMQVC